MKFQLAFLVIIATFGLTSASDFCAAMGAAKGKIDSLSTKFPRFAKMTLATAAKIICSEKAYNVILTSKFKDISLNDLNSPDSFESYRTEILSSDLGSMTFNEIFGATEAMKSLNIAKMAGLEEFADVPLSDLEKIKC